MDSAKAKPAVVRPIFGKAGGTAFRAVVHVAVVIGAILVFVPVVYVLSSSIKQATDIFKIPFRWIPSPFVPQNYTEALKIAPFGRYFINSLIVSVATTVLNVFFS